MANYADSTRTPRTLTEREQSALLKVTGEHRAGYRDDVLYAMTLGTGLREHELIALSVGDVFRDGRSSRSGDRFTPQTLNDSEPLAIENAIPGRRANCIFDL